MGRLGLYISNDIWLACNREWSNWKQKLRNIGAFSLTTKECRFNSGGNVEWLEALYIS